MIAEKLDSNKNKKEEINKVITVILIKGTIHQKPVTAVNIYVPNVGTPNSINKY